VSATLSQGATPSATATGTPTQTPSATPTPICPPPVTSMQTLSGLESYVPTYAGSNVVNWAGTCGGYSLYANLPKQIYRIDLSAFLIGGSLTVQNCNSTSDTIIAVGTGCPTDATTFGCLQGADGGCPSGSITPSLVTVAATTRNVYYVIVQMWSSGGTSLVTDFSWRYTPPTPSPTPTQSRTGTPTGTGTTTPTATGTPPETPSNTATVTTVPTPSITASPSNSLAADQSPSGTASPSYTSTSSVSATPSSTASTTSSITSTPTPTNTITPTVTRTPTATRTRTPTASPQCPYPGATIYSATGLSGTIASVSASYSLGWAATATCAGTTSTGGATTYSPYTTNVKTIVKIDLSAFPIGGLLSVSNCGLSTTDSRLFVGANCPISAATFGCVASNE
jgi:hypothetical protein